MEKLQLSGYELNDDIFTEFLSLNQTLRELDVHSISLTSTILESIGSYCKSLEVLRMEMKMLTNEHSMIVLIERHLHHLKGLRKIQKFEINNAFCLEFLLNIFAENGCPIRSIIAYTLPTVITPYFPTLKTLENLILDSLCGVSGDFLIKLVRSQTALKTLIVKNKRVRMHTIEEMKLCEFAKIIYQIEYQIGVTYTEDFAN